MNFSSHCTTQIAHIRQNVLSKYIDRILNFTIGPSDGDHYRPFPKYKGQLSYKVAIVL